jgi:hypothetical protein
MGIDFGLVGRGAPAAGLTAATGAVTTTATITSTSAVTSTTPALPSTGVQLEPQGRLLLGLAAAIGLLGALGLALEARPGRRSTFTERGGEDA